MSKLDRQLYAHNSLHRQVRNLYEINFGEFLLKSCGNFLISGGHEYRRRAALFDTIMDMRNRSDESIVIFSGDGVLKKQLIEEAGQNESFGELHVADLQYCDYDFFRSMPPYFIGRFFEQFAALHSSPDTSSVAAYADAFISALELCDPDISLSSMLRFCRNSDADIISVVGDEEIKYVLEGSAAGGVAFRNLVSKAFSAFSPLTERGCASGFSISELIDGDCVIFIDTPVQYKDPFALYFATELLSVMSRKKFNVIFDNSPLISSKVMADTVEDLKRSQNTVVLCYGDIIANTPENAFPSGFNRHLIFLGGDTPAEDLQKMLSSFGSYSDLSKVNVKGSGQKIIYTPMFSETEHTVQYQRDRVLLQEEMGNEALLQRGSDSEIVIAKNLILQEDEKDGKRFLWFGSRPSLKP